MDTRERQLSPQELKRIPDFVKTTLSEDGIKQLAATIRDYEKFDNTQVGEVCYTGQSGRITGYGSRLNIYNTIGFYNSADIPLNVLDAMKKDSQISLGMSIVKYPISNLGFTVECNNQEIKAVVEYMLGRIWYKFLRDCLMSLDHGFSTFEKVWDSEIIDVDPGKYKHKFIKKKYIFLKKLKPLHPKTIELNLDELNNFIGLTQIGATKNGKPIRLNRQKCLLFTYQEEYGNYFGKSRLASAYEPWYWKIISTQFFLRYMERHSIPPYVVRYPTGNSRTPNGTFPNSDLAIKYAQAISSYGNTTMPSKRDDKGEYVWDVNKVEQTGQALSLKETNDVWDRAILRGLLLPDREAVSGLTPEIASEVFISTLGDVVKNVEETVNEDIIKPFIYWNYGPDEREYCRVNIDDIDFQKREEMRKLMSKILDTSATFIKQTNTLPYDVFPDMERILDVLDVPSVPLKLYTLKDENGKVIKNSSQKTGGPDKGELTPGNQSRTGRDGSPRNDQKAENATGE